LLAFGLAGEEHKLSHPGSFVTWGWLTTLAEGPGGPNQAIFNDVEAAESWGNDPLPRTLLVVAERQYRGVITPRAPRRTPVTWPS
jgi:hypothetical protein